MESKILSECYEAVCAQHEIKINPHISDTLKRTTEAGNISLNLSGNDRFNRIQRISDKDVFSLSICLQNNQCVSGLDLRYNNIGDEGAGHLADIIQAGDSSLRSLDLKFNNIQKNGAEDLASSLRCNSSLLTLRLCGNKIGDRGVLHLAQMLQINNTLQELQLSECDLAISGLLAIITVLKDNTVLRSLDISRALLFSQQEEWAMSFSDMLEVNSSLVELHLGKMGLTDTGMERLAEGLKKNRTLRYLDLRCNRVARDGALHLSKMLKQNSTLEVIDLTANRIEDQGCVYLSEALTSPGCVLKELSVCKNNISTEGLLSLAQAMKTNPTLTHLYIWGNRLEEPVCQAFRELMSSNRLPPEQTDVSDYEVDGHVFLAEVNQSLRKGVSCVDSTDTSNDAGTSFSSFL